MIEVYNPNTKPPLRMPQLTLEVSLETRHIYIDVVDPANGKALATLWISGAEDGSKFPYYAREAISEAGFDTSWAQWDVSGRFIFLKK